MAVLDVQRATKTGLNPVFAAADVAGDEFANGGHTALHVKNGSAAEISVTAESPTPCNQGYTHNQVVAVPAGEERVIGPFEPNRFNSAVGRVKVSYSAADSVTVAAIEI